MKLKLFVLATGVCVLQGALAAQPGDAGRWVGVWQGELDGQPGVTVTLGRDAGDLAGTIVFNVLTRDNGEQPHVIGHDAHVLTHVNVDGSSLAFQVTRLGDARELHLKMKLTGDGKAVLECGDCGGPGATELDRIH